MGFALKLDVPISETVCNFCNITDKTQQISSGNLNIIYQIPISGENNNVLNSDFVVLMFEKLNIKK